MSDPRWHLEWQRRYLAYQRRTRRPRPPARGKRAFAFLILIILAFGFFVSFCDPW